MKNYYFLLVSLILIFITAGYRFLVTQDISAEVANISLVDSEVRIAGAVVPHHNLVADQRSELFAELKENSDPKTVILVSPDHFGFTNKPITTQKIWDTAGGELIANKELIERLVTDESLEEVESGGWSEEHGITNILGDIKATWPKAKIVPIMIPEISNVDVIAKLTSALTENCQDCLLIASVDFSHYQPAEVAEVHDRFSLRSLQNMDEEAIWQSEVDSPASLALLISWSKERGAKHFNVVSHTNSGLLEDNYDGETTSHIMGWFSDEDDQASSPEVTFMFGGDVMLGRDIASRYQNGAFTAVWEQLGGRLFRGVDISYINLEGPLIKDEIVPELKPNNLLFYFPTTAADSVASQYLKYAGLANNHTGTLGRDDFTYTQKRLKQVGVIPVGDPGKVEPYHIEATQNTVGTWLVTVNLLDTPENEAVSQVVELQQQYTHELIIVIPHWGIEYQTRHNQTQERLAREWIKAGADLVVGGHPHVVQDSQIIDGVPVFYSLGNLVFDQYFSTETQQGILLSGYYNEQEMKLVVTPYNINKGVPKLTRGESKLSIINSFCIDWQKGGLTEDCSQGVLQLRTTTSN